MKRRRQHRHLTAEDFDPEKAQAKYEREFKQDTPHLSTGTYWWVVAMNEGKRYIIGPSYSEADAYALGYEKLECEFSVIPLRTRSTQEATRCLKGKRLQDNASLEDATRRVRHKV